MLCSSAVHRPHPRVERFNRSRIASFDTGFGLAGILRALRKCENVAKSTSNTASLCLMSARGDAKMCMAFGRLPEPVPGQDGASSGNCRIRAAWTQCPIFSLSGPWRLVFSQIANLRSPCFLPTAASALLKSSRPEAHGDGVGKQRRGASPHGVEGIAPARYRPHFGLGSA